LDYFRNILTWRELIVEMAFHRLTGRYRRSILGPFWITLGFLIFALGITTLWATLLDRPFAHFFPYVTLGIFAWNLTGGMLVESSRSFAESRNLLLQCNAPTVIYPLISVLKNIMQIPNYLVVVIPVCLMFGASASLQLLWLMPGLGLLILFSACVAVIMAYLGAFLPDLSELVSSSLRFIFFLTPTIWTIDMRPGMPPVWLANPFYYAIELVRGPVLGTSEPVFIFSVAFGLTVLAALIAVACVRFAGDAVKLRVE
tara:strand:+ start:5135 stop:5905 length:771 start_codon:yes stop_codon:yes gene_type:complete